MRAHDISLQCLAVRARQDSPAKVFCAVRRVATALAAPTQIGVRLLGPFPLSLLLMAFSPPALAAPGTLAEAPGVGIGQMLSVLAGLLLVLGIFAALVWGLKRSRALNLSGSAQLEVLGGLSFGMRDRVVLVRAEGRRVLLAVGPNGISALSEWGDEAAAQAAATADFHGALQAASASTSASAINAVSAASGSTGSSTAKQAAPQD